MDVIQPRCMCLYVCVFVQFHFIQIVVETKMKNEKNRSEIVCFDVENIVDVSAIIVMIS